MNAKINDGEVKMDINSTVIGACAFDLNWINEKTRVHFSGSSGGSSPPRKLRHVQVFSTLQIFEKESVGGIAKSKIAAIALFKFQRRFWLCGLVVFPNKLNHSFTCNGWWTLKEVCYKWEKPRMVVHYENWEEQED